MNFPELFIKLISDEVAAVQSVSDPAFGAENSKPNGSRIVTGPLLGLLQTAFCPTVNDNCGELTGQF
uniref:Glutaminase n=1 Tax=Caenorhabditis tropicalis TaxID=1561998 RepID=A0A1I7TFU0_9PELO